MRLIDQIYIDGAFVTPHGSELFDLYNPATAQVIGRVRLADAEDARRAIAAAKQAFRSFSGTDKAVRLGMLRRMHESVSAHADELTEAVIEEYGAPMSRARWMAAHASNVLLDAAKGLVAVLVAAQLAGPDAAIAAALGAVLGHLFPVWLGFKGGKGMAAVPKAVGAEIKICCVVPEKSRILRGHLHRARRWRFLFALLEPQLNKNV